MPNHVAFIGFGEAAIAFLSGWGDARPGGVSAFDIKTTSVAFRSEMLARYAAYAVSGAETSTDALADAEAAFSVVTADQAMAAARSAATGPLQGTLWFDCNSCAPDTKRKAAELIEGAGGRYVDVAIMAPVHPLRHKVPLLISGAHAEAARDVLSALGMVPGLAGDEVGQASMVKMLRSVMIKGMEALTAECLLAARRAGVDDQVLSSLTASDPDTDWRQRGAYNLERMMKHGTRRAAEMREVAATLGALGLPAGMSIAAAGWQSRIGKTGAESTGDDLASRADEVLRRL